MQNGGGTMKIEATPKEIADLVRELQSRQEKPINFTLDGKTIVEPVLGNTSNALTPNVKISLDSKEI